jgi:hypothetical protein
MHPSSFKNAKNRFDPVARVDEEGLRRGIMRLLSDGEKVLDYFQEAFKFLSEQCGASKTTVNHDGHDMCATSVGPLKGYDRILEKCLNDYAKDKPPMGSVCDVVRATMAFESPGQMLRAVETLVKWDGASLNSGWSYRIAQAKDLYSKKLQTLYGDLKLSLLFFIPNVPDGHVCELQLNTVKMIAAKASPKGHAVYECERTLAIKWLDEHPGSKSAPTLKEIESDLGFYYSEPPTDKEGREAFDEGQKALVAKYAGKSKGMQDARLTDYLDLYKPLMALAAEANQAARDAFDQHADTPALLLKTGILAKRAADRWNDRYANETQWTKMDLG